MTTWPASFVLLRHVWERLEGAPLSRRRVWIDSIVRHAARIPKLVFIDPYTHDFVTSKSKTAGGEKAFCGTRSKVELQLYFKAIGRFEQRSRGQELVVHAVGQSLARERKEFLPVHEGTDRPVHRKP